jgi:hypothetical protein
LNLYIVSYGLKFNSVLFAFRFSGNKSFSLDNFPTVNIL